MGISHITLRLAAGLVATLYLCAADGYGQKLGRGGGQGEGQGQSASNNPGRGANPGSGTRSGRGNRSANAPTGGGISNPVGGALSRQSLSGSNNARGSNSTRGSDGNSNRTSVSQGTSSRLRGGGSRDGSGTGIQPIIRSNNSNNSASTTGSANTPTAASPGTSTATTPSGTATTPGKRSTRTEGGRREQQTFFRGPTNRLNNRDNFGNRNRNDNDRDNDGNNFVKRDRDNRDNIASRDRDNRDFDGRFRDDRNRFDNNRNRFDNSNDWERFGRSVARNLAVRNGVVPFSYGWYNNYQGGRWPTYSPFLYSRWQNQPYYWWGWTPANRLMNNWFVFSWDRPRYWNYGPGGNIYYQDNYVYYDGNRYAPVAEYYQRMYDLAHSAPAIDPSQAEGMDWAPLGVFAAARDNTSSSEDRTIQLAVNKDGVIAGTYYTPKSDKVLALTGMVDSHSQRAAWTFADDEHQSTIFETSVFNLTKPESTVMVHYGPESNQTEVWHLVRLEQPDTSNVNANPQAAAGHDLP